MKWLLAVALFVVLTEATSPYLIPSSCQFNPGSLLQIPTAFCDRFTTKETCEKHKFACWWRNTTNQNALAEHTENDFPLEMLIPYQDSQLTIYVYSSHDITNVAALVGPQSYMIIGCGGSKTGAENARAAFAKAIPNFETLPLAGIVLTHSHVDHLWSCPVFYPDATKPKVIYAQANFPTALQQQSAVQSALFPRANSMFGMNLPWGADQHLGVGIGYTWKAPPPQPYVLPTVYIPMAKNITFSGVTLTLIPSPGETDDQMVAFLPYQRIAFPADNLYKAMANVYTIRGTVARPISKWISAMDTLNNLKPVMLIPEHSLPVMGEDTCKSTMLAYRDALQYIHDQTVIRANRFEHPNDISLNITLPEPLASHPYLQQFYGYIPFISQSIFDYYFGWFSGDAADLEHMTTVEAAKRLVKFGGGPVKTLHAAREAITDTTKDGIIFALKLTDALRKTHPSTEANTIYLQALKMLGWGAVSATARNWYLSAAQKVVAGDKKEETFEIEADDALHMPIEMVLANIGTRAIVPEGTPLINAHFHFTDEDISEWVITARFPVVVAENRTPEAGEATVSVSVTSQALRQAMANAHAGIAKDLLSSFTVVKGDRAHLQQLLRMFV